MPPKPNGFYMFMMAEKKKIKDLTHRSPPMKDMPGICMDKWKRLPGEEKARYNALAKKEISQSGNDGTHYRLDSHRQVIADRKDPLKEDKKRRDQEKQSIQNSFAHQDIRDAIFHIVDFQVMYDERMEDHFPLEIGMVSWTLRKGIINFMHRFIDPGEVPQGLRHLANSHSENTHKIPLHFEHAQGNMKDLSNHIMKFMKSDSEGDEIPPVYCLSIHRAHVEDCLNFIYNKAFFADVDQIQDIYCLEDLVNSFISHNEKSGITAAESQVLDMLIQNRWDYNSSIGCSYHIEQDCSHCSLSKVRRYSFALFDQLSSKLKFDLTAKHMPDEVPDNYLVPQASFGFGQSKYQTDDDQRVASNRSRSHQSNQANAWQPPTVQPVKVSLKDDEDEDDEDETHKTTDFCYKKLRLPKSLAQVQTQVGEMSLGDENRTSNPSGPAAVPANPMANPHSTFRADAPLIPRGRGMAPGRRPQLRPRGMALPPQPPPGFLPRPSFPMAGKPVLRQPLLQDDFPPLGRGGR